LKAAGGVLTAKQAPHRPSIAPALGLSAGVNLTAQITGLAADPTGAHVYAVYGKEDASGTDRLYLAEFHPDSSGNLTLVHAAAGVGERR
jgi:hypothetical protein